MPRGFSRAAISDLFSQHCIREARTSTEVLRVIALYIFSLCAWPSSPPILFPLLPRVHFDMYFPLLLFSLTPPPPAPPNMHTRLSYEFMRLEEDGVGDLELGLVHEDSGGKEAHADGHGHDEHAAVLSV